jgi:hypothetical protein
MDVAEFLLARIAEDEAYARLAAEPSDGDGRTAEWTEDASGVLWTGDDYHPLGDSALSRHIERWDPARVLAECEAKRRVVAAYQDERSRRDIYESEESRAVEDDEQRMHRRSAAARCRGLEIAIEALAAVYADHSDHRDEWAV